MRQFKITVNGKAYDVQVEENGAVASAPVVQTTAVAAVPTAPQATPVSEPVSSPVSAPAAVGEGTPIEAPMPGTILKILVSNGQSVNEGDAVVVLEAMKMENEITAPKSGTITAVCVNTGDSVDAGKVLVTIQ